MTNIRALTPLDKALEAFGASFLIASLVIPIIYYSKMPARIPTHFDMSGLPDGYGSKIHVLIVPWIGVAIYVGLFLMKRFTRYMNYPVPVTEENRAVLLTLTLQMMRWIRLCIASLFLMLITSMVLVGTGESTRANIYIIVYFLLALAAIMGIYMYRMILQHKETES